MVKKNNFNKVIKHKNGDYFNYKGKQYYIDGKNIVIDFKNGEEEFANILSKLITKRIELLPRFNKPDGIKTADSKIGNIYVDFKITTSGTDKFIFNNVNIAKEQSNHFIFWIKNNDIPLGVIKYQIDDIFRRIKSVNTIGYYRNRHLKIYKRK